MAYLVLEDGTMYEGAGFGAATEVVSDVVFTTGMTGYLEALTDPSYYGQIVMMTYPLIGNIGVNWEDPESIGPQIGGLICREICENPSNWYSAGSLNEYLTQHGIPGIQGIDTRALTRKLRNSGTMHGILTPDLPTEEQLARMRAYHNTRPIAAVSCKEKFDIPGEGRHIAVLDYGVKASILSSLRRRGCALTVYPYDAPAAEILEDDPDGILLSNGPGDPAEHPEVADIVRELMGKKPMMGICMGHLMLARAAGAGTEALRYGHRGANHPVKDLAKDRIYITSQNHGYCVADDLPAGIEVSHRSWNDQTIEGLRYTDIPAFTVQFHPEASPGPKDTGYLFDEFMQLVERCK
jgi:carbamoyl-phosphate synthase small subunit